MTDREPAVDRLAMYRLFQGFRGSFDEVLPRRPGGQQE